MEYKYDVFISYSRKDSKIADLVCAAFEKKGINYFIDRDIIKGASIFPEVIAAAIKDSKVFLMLGSKDCYESSFAINEATCAFKRTEGKGMLLYRIDNSDLPDGLDYIFSSTNWRNMREHPIEPVLVDDVIQLLRQKRHSQKIIGSAPYTYEKRDKVELHVEVDTDCHVYRFHKEILVARKGQDNVLMLERGKHKLLFAALEYPMIKEEQIVNITDTVETDFIEVTLSRKIENLRKEREEAERKTREEAERQKREKAKVENERKAREEAARKAREKAERKERIKEERLRKRETRRRNRRNRSIFSRRTASHNATNTNNVTEEKKWYIKTLLVIIGCALFGLFVGVTCDGFVYNFFAAFIFSLMMFWPLCFKQKIGCIIWIINFIILYVLIFFFDFENKFEAIINNWFPFQ